MIPNWLSPYLGQNDLGKIQSAVAVAEKKTSGEIVPMIVRRSSTVGHVPAIIFCLGTLFYYMLEFYHWAPVAWMDSWWFVILWTLILAPLSILLGKNSILQRLLVSKKDRSEQSIQRAMNEFYLAGLNKTEGATGILLFVSLVDHQVVVLADKGIHEKINSEEWSKVKEDMLKGIGRKDMATGFCEAIKHCGDLLEIHFPVQADDINELPNQLVIKSE